MKSFIFTTYTVHIMLQESNTLTYHWKYANKLKILKYNSTIIFMETHIEYL